MKETLHHLYQQSLKQYRALYELTMELEEIIFRANVEEIVQITKEIEEQKETIRITDTRINSYGQEEHQQLEPTLHNRHLEIMKKIIEKNNELSPRMQAMMALQSAELAKIKQGRNTLGGYTISADQAGQIINASH